ncbi:transcriptional regulator [Elizabethkingia miricola]|uniref:Helix-turn-helix domain-containing protein n=1 Tax=Elizabethkingia miricola TaxID=172045 RepID=A0ABD5B6T6_ELIMR|nr:MULTISPECIES: helix-turn-helix domain-containing protein [Elizabethkingia]MDQ8749559.1 helix-turn-helix domain-containing protein [Elizabethkingia miricola]NHQ66367.1 helix-turn-helix transcriptional regulator [Elizabethkingia miricola]NHQ70614.1 helix-turn-helix transcriptional regulator [Elizabethkingia miricola]NHQ76630.1 helix-turn-helix transcriptional regulator [Elizabethkingia miricola]OBS13673.1 transcriptional regulator [Elizabethkingia miricola]
MTKIKDTSTNFANKKALAEECQEVYAVNIIGGQWTLAICCYLINGKLRFSELKQCLPNITERMLALELKKLVKHKIIQKFVYAEVPARVEYEMTPIGYKLHNIIKELGTWGNEHQELTGSNKFN